MEYPEEKHSSTETSERRWSGLHRLSGILLIATAVVWLVVSFTARTLYSSGYPNNAEAYLQLVSQHQVLALVTWSLWIVADLLLIAPTVSLYIILQRHNRTLALLGSALSMFFNIYDVSVTELNSLTLVSLSHGYTIATADVLRVPFVAAATYGYSALPLQTVLSFAIGTLAYLFWCVPMAKSVFRRWTAVFGIVINAIGFIAAAAPVVPSSTILYLFQFICVPGIAVWFIIVGVQLYNYARRFSANADDP